MTAIFVWCLASKNQGRANKQLYSKFETPLSITPTHNPSGPTLPHFCVGC